KLKEKIFGIKEVDSMKKWTIKLFSVILVLSIITGCGTTNDQTPNQDQNQTPMNDDTNRDDNTNLNRDQGTDNNDRGIQDNNDQGILDDNNDSDLFDDDKATDPDMNNNNTNQ